DPELSCDGQGNFVTVKRYTLRDTGLEIFECLFLVPQAVKKRGGLDFLGRFV
ncbi:MAG: hypothetical protein ACI9CE_002919, partial [Flavobacterium sp.]